MFLSDATRGSKPAGLEIPVQATMVSEMPIPKRAIEKFGKSRDSPEDLKNEAFCIEQASQTGFVVIIDVGGALAIDQG
ncbi:hypothetical protein K239x_41410 [Planctomycetes bacterium K23_9]|uniref:Uncharacterized protein n=1 Tax=Stieleria marina TaxID=1930275 RepID=A0A517NYD9_9BACT|nr:hypothetical protein K239x_41410 [Planctomycetes bacterium K23_9]